MTKYVYDDMGGVKMIDIEVTCQKCKHLKDSGLICDVCNNYSKFEECEVEIHNDNKCATVEIPVEDKIMNKIENLEKKFNVTVLDEAKAIVNGDRNGQYGEPEDSFAEIAALWEIYLECAISPRDVAMMMILLKVARDNHKCKRDNLVDICGYAACAERLKLGGYDE